MLKKNTWYVGVLPVRKIGPGGCPHRFLFPLPSSFVFVVDVAIFAILLLSFVVVLVAAGSDRGSWMRFDPHTSHQHQSLFFPHQHPKRSRRSVTSGGRCARFFFFFYWLLTVIVFFADSGEEGRIFGGGQGHG